MCLSNPYKSGPWRKASRTPELLISLCLAMPYSSCCGEGIQPGFSLQMWLLMFPQGKCVLTGKCVSQHTCHGYAQSMGRTTRCPSSPSFRGCREPVMEHKLTSELLAAMSVWLGAVFKTQCISTQNCVPERNQSTGVGGKAERTTQL